MNRAAFAASQLCRCCLRAPGAMAPAASGRAVSVAAKRALNQAQWARHSSASAAAAAAPATPLRASSRPCSSRGQPPTRYSTSAQLKEVPHAEPESGVHCCWNCGSAVARQDLFCQCGSMQPLSRSAVNYFELLGTPVGVTIDPRAVERRFWALQKQLHPDLHAVKPGEEQAISAANTAFVNQAYQALREPVMRVQYILQLMKGQDDAAAAMESERPVAMPDPELLMSVYETREQLEECESEDDARHILTGASQATARLLDHLASAVARGNVLDVEQGLTRLQYLHKIEVEARDTVHRLADAAAAAARRRSRNSSFDELQAPAPATAVCSAAAAAAAARGRREPEE